MNRPDGPFRSHLFTVRVWKEQMGTERSEWRGRVQLLSTRETRYFREWAGLITLLIAMLAEADADQDTEQ
jgi:hypothetical protein